MKVKLPKLYILIYKDKSHNKLFVYWGFHLTVDKAQLKAFEGLDYISKLHPEFNFIGEHTIILTLKHLFWAMLPFNVYMKDFGKQIK